MPGSVQKTFVEVLLGLPGVLQRDVANRIGVDRSMVSRWRTGERGLNVEDALYLVERFGPKPLVAAARMVDVELVVADPLDTLEGDARDVMVGVLAALLRESVSLTERLKGVRESSLTDGERIDLVRRLAALEGMCRAAQAALLSEARR